MFTVSGTTGDIRIFPVPLYTFTNPSPATADPTILFVDFSTVKFSESDHAIAKFPSILIWSFSNSTSINSSLGTGLSNTAIPCPDSFKLNSPSPPNTADDKFYLITTFVFNDASHAKNNPSSSTIPLFHVPTSSNNM